MPDALLVGSISRNKTSILLRKVDGSSIVVMSFSQTIDLINASLSDDNELVHITERVTSTITRRVGFRAAIYDVHGISKPFEAFYSSPVDGIFIAKPSHYHLLLYTSSQIHNFQVKRDKKGIDRKDKGSIKSVIWMNFWRGRLSIISDHRTGQAYQSFSPNSNFGWTPISEVAVSVHENAQLPWELSLLPNGGSRLPLFRYCNYRFFIVEVSHTICFIQQLFDQKGNLAFNLSVFPTGLSETIPIADVSPDVPICFARFGDVLVLFGPNAFICLIDLKSKVPFIRMLPKWFVSACCGQCAESIPHSNSVIDLDSGDAFALSVSYKSPELLARAIDGEVLLGCAMLAERTNNPETIADLLHVFEWQQNLPNMVRFFQHFFSLLPQSVVRRASEFGVARRRVRIPDPFREILNAMEIQSPSAGRRSRTNFFLDHMSIRKHLNEETYTKVLQMLHEQNNAMLTLHAAFDRWVKELKATAVWQAVVAIVLQFEAMVNDCPEVPQLRTEMQDPSNMPVSRVMQHRLRSCRLFQEETGDELRELRYWKIKYVEDADIGDEPSIATPRMPLETMDCVRPPFAM
jgi:hypothetical protein